MNTPAIIRNDFIRDFAASPRQLVNELTAVLNGGNGGPVLGQAVEVLPSKHSTEVSLYMMTGGKLTEITEENLEEMDWFRERVTKALSEIGFKAK